MDQGRLSVMQDETRERREQELNELLETRLGRIKLWDLFTRYYRAPERKLPPSGPVLVESILAYEFPA